MNSIVCIQFMLIQQIFGKHKPWSRRYWWYKNEKGVKPALKQVTSESQLEDSRSLLGRNLLPKGRRHLT